ncbi:MULTISPECIES: pyridoxal phosphate-dependent aminotransferase [Bradyrhizobium]|uniref:Aminotransferase n=1 Tax=Bradyrhizobium elkanii TaxID=29448 RepID=A0A4U6RH71_BRAEL|nr:pyridoxal phosphate-dependent aminotransferase [Bradyrhizobium elkanii]MTV11825.1 pyridoxal phosphate-dependent aminotransferase [Bradyrhizobium sp. BR2003]TKV73657.1 pyridoxal phosphate-dependent aminotransferase [Bradyrhizobium elkanii]
MSDEADWQGRFPRNEIISLLDVNRRYNLAESTAQDLTLGEILDLAGGAAALGGLKMGYGTSAGLPRLRTAIAALTGVLPEEVVTTQGTALGLFMLAFELCRPGDEAVIAMPSFPPSRDSLVGAGVTLRECRLTFDQGFKLTVGALEPLLNERTKLVSIASPQNPSGVRATLDEIKAILDLMRVKSPAARLFVDETYRDATYGDETPPRSAAAVDDAVITGGSVSKAHGAPGLRVGWLTVRDPALRERLTVAKMNMVISGSPLDETLASVILETREKILGARRGLLAAGLSKVAAWVDAQAGRVQWVRPDGGAMCCLRLSPNVFDDGGIARFWSTLPAAELQIGDGAWFGESSAVLRLGFGYLPIDVLPAALDALSNAIETAVRPDPVGDALRPPSRVVV